MTHDAETTPHLSRAIALRAHAWLRERHPGARVDTAHVPLPGGEIACRATITLASGAQTSAHGVADAIRPGALLEAEDLAVVRAAEQVGWTAFAVDPAPVTPAPAAEAATSEGTSVIPAATEGAGRPQGQKQLAGKAADLGDPITRRPAGGGRPVGEGRAVKEAAPTWSADLADTSWTAFWGWARERGYQSGADVEAKIGRQIRSLTPRQARDLLLAADEQP
jgi:hypothetical protein